MKLTQWFYLTEKVGVQLPDPKAVTRVEKRSLKQLEKGVFKAGGQITVPMLWTNQPEKLPNSFKTAMSQLTLTKQRLRKVGLLEQYGDGIRKDEEKGYIQKLSATEAQELLALDWKWYIPHFFVVHLEKPWKLRCVFDVPCTTGGVSLNSMLTAGPNLLNPLFLVLDRFCEGEFAASADIKAMFSQVATLPEDSRMLNMLWRDGEHQEPVVYQSTGHIFGAICSPMCVNFAVRKAAAEVEAELPGVTESVEDYFYVDDYLHSNNTKEKAIKNSQDVRQALAEGGFNLTQFKSNSVDILDQLQASPGQAPKKLEAREALAQGKALGLY